MKRHEANLAEGVLFTDFYQLTMGQVYFQQKIHEHHAQFDYFFRSYPDYGIHRAGYCIHAGMDWLLNWMESSFFDPSSIGYLRNLYDSNNDNPIFSKNYLDYLSGKSIIEGIHMHAIPEGRVVHPYIPLAVIEGPILFAQLIESSLLNHLNYQTLIATKSSRIFESGMGQMMLEFGLRRAQDRAATAGARAAIIGGAAGTSNVGASAVLGIQPSGTHAHSMIQAFVAMGGTELDAFRAYASSYPDQCILLVDTYNTLESGIPNAIKVFEELKKKGHDPAGIRLDSGDLAFLSIQAAKMLDKAGFPNTKIVLSNQMDELVIWQIITQIKEEAPRYDIDPGHLIKRLAFGVGTRMITSGIDPALDGVYKLVAIKESQDWVPAMKISENPEKTLNPGHKHIWRIYDDRQKAIADVMGCDDENISDYDNIELFHPTDASKHRSLKRNSISKIESLFESILDDGKIIFDRQSLDEIRENRKNDLNNLHTGVKRIMNPHHYHVSLTRKLWLLKQNMTKSLQNGAN